MDKKHLYCKKCKEFPDAIKEVYKQFLEETRKWDGSNYALVDSNIDNIEYVQLCAYCDTKLIEK